jgi:hypothetical protein
MSFTFLFTLYALGFYCFPYPMFFSFYPPFAYRDLYCFLLFGMANRSTLGFSRVIIQYINLNGAVLFAEGVLVGIGL